MRRIIRPTPEAPERTSTVCPQGVSQATREEDSASAQASRTQIVVESCHSWAETAKVVGVSIQSTRRAPHLVRLMVRQAPRQHRDAAVDLLEQAPVCRAGRCMAPIPSRSVPRIRSPINSSWRLLAVNSGSVFSDQKVSQNCPRSRSGLRLSLKAASAVAASARSQFATRSPRRGLLCGIPPSVEAPT